MKNIIAGLSMPANIRFFGQIDKRETIKRCQQKLEKFQQQWNKKRGHNRGGIVSSTIDVLYAIIACIEPTLQDIAEHQPAVIEQAINSNEYFAFIYRSTLATKINNSQHHHNIRLCTRTISNQITRLLQAGIIIKRQNYCLKYDKNGRLTNPLPTDKNERGRGKIQLFLCPSVLVFKPDFQRKLDHLKNTFQQYSTSTFIPKNTIKTILDNALNVDKKAVLATANAKTINVNGQEQGRKPIQKNNFGKRQFGTKREYFSFQILNSLLDKFFPNRKLDSLSEKQSIACISDVLAETERKVQAFRKIKIKSFRQSDAYVEAKNKHLALRRFKEHRLPDVERAAQEILSFALCKQLKHANKNNYLYKIRRQNNSPLELLTSSNFKHALSYSFDDWHNANDRLFKKNLSYQTYSKALKEIGNIYSKCLIVSFESVSHSYLIAYQKYQKILANLRSKTELTNSHKKALICLFRQLLSPLFKTLTEADKARIIHAQQTCAA